LSIVIIIIIIIIITIRNDAATEAYEIFSYYDAVSFVKEYVKKNPETAMVSVSINQSINQSFNHSFIQFNYIYICVCETYP